MEMESIKDNEPEVPGGRKSPKSPSPLSVLFDFTETCVTAAVIAILILFFVAKTGTVVGESMMDTMHPGDRYILTDLFYTPEQGDIIVFAPDEQYVTGNSGKLWVKRVIATEGQTVEIRDGLVYVDNELLNEPYLREGTVTLPHLTENPFEVPEGHVFVMGDNRQNSRDSRYIGSVDVRQIIGHVIFRFWPLDNAGTVD